jgi:cell division FtsZ-interacting protein ZapD
MWLLVSTAGGVLAAAPANQRWAIVATDDVRERGVVDLLTAQLSQVGGIELVERDAIQRVLDELKLNAGGLVDRTKAVQFGQLLAADALLRARSRAVARRGCVGTGTPAPAASRAAVDGHRA